MTVKLAITELASDKGIVDGVVTLATINALEVV